MKTVSVLAISLACMSSAGCTFSGFSGDSSRVGEAKPPMDDPVTLDSVDAAKREPIVAKFEWSAKAEMEQVLATPFDKCGTKEFLSASSSATDKAFPVAVAQKIKPEDRTSKCRIRAIVREGKACELADAKLRDDCEKLKLAVKVLTSGSSVWDADRKAKIMYSTYFFDPEAFPVSKFGSAR